MKPKFNAGKNVAMKVPAHEYEKTITFYRDILGLECLSDVVSHTESSIRFAFGDKVLWVDRVDGISQAEIWLEVTTDRVDQASDYLEKHGCTLRNEIEPLPDGFSAFWLSSPCNIVHLVAGEARS